MLIKKLPIHLILLGYLLIGVLHQIYYDDAYKLLGISGSIKFARIWPVIGFVLIAGLWILWAVTSWQNNRKLRKANQKINHLEPIVESHQRSIEEASEEDQEYVRED